MGHSCGVLRQASNDQTLSNQIKDLGYLVGYINGSTIVVIESEVVSILHEIEGFVEPRNNIH